MPPLSKENTPSKILEAYPQKILADNLAYNITEYSVNLRKNKPFPLLGKEKSRLLSQDRSEGWLPLGRND